MIKDSKGEYCTYCKKNGHLKDNSLKAMATFSKLCNPFWCWEDLSCVKWFITWILIKGKDGSSIIMKGTRLTNCWWFFNATDSDLMAIFERVYGMLDKLWILYHGCKHDTRDYNILE